ncbi:MAG: gamma-glutamyltransferase, partial [Acetobacteraceae bacterium]|nr:gamma-glutamyltransferase [Acetobacteraceae bacterium]
MITAPQPEAAEAGAAVLASGGTAVDAVLACALTQGVVDPLMCGIGGLGVMQVHDPARGRTEVFDGLSTCPAAAHATMWADRFERECPDGFGYVVAGHVNELGHQAVTTPGILRVFAAAHEAFGRMAWSALFAPAIGFATEGWILRPHVAGVFATDERAYGRLPYRDKLALTADGRRLYLRPDGTPKRLGDRVLNPDLATTLSAIARDGAAAFYNGALARRIADDMARNDGLLALGDLASFRSRRVAPLRVDYRGRTVALPPPPTGGVVIGQMLRILERFDLVAFGHNTPEYVRVLAEAMKIAGRDKDEFIGDPDFVAPPLERLLSDGYAEECAARIRRGEVAPLSRVLAEPADTTTVSCVDADGMIASLTHTLGVPSGVIPPGAGFMLNGGMNWYD